MLEDDNEKDDKKSEKSSMKIGEKFLKERRIFLWGPVNDKSAKEIISQLMYLELEEPGKEISFFINSPGGMVTSGMAIMDTMKIISSPISTICMGLAASMGSLLLSEGDKGKRFIFPHGRVMIHQPSIGGFQGTASDLAITVTEINKTKLLSAEILAKNCGQKVDKVLADFDRDHWMNADDSLDYGIVDGIYKG